MKDTRFEGHGAKGGLAQPVTAADAEHQLGHQSRAAGEAPVSGLIMREAGGSQTIGEGDGLMEGEAQTFASDGIDRAGGVANEGEVAAIDIWESAIGGDGSAFGGGMGSGGEAGGQLGKLSQGMIQTKMGVAGNERGANFLRADGGYIDLAASAPVQFHVIGPGRDAIVYAETVAEAEGRLGGEASPLPNAGMEAIGADDPTGGDGFTQDGDARRADGGYGRAPQHAHAGGCGGLHHSRMEDCAAHTERVAFGKGGGHGNAAIDEANAVEGLRVKSVQRYAEAAQGGQAIGHQAFAANLVDGRACAIGEGDIETFAARGNGRREARGTASDDEYTFMRQ